MDTQKFYEQYHQEHYCCPKCHCRNYSTTLAAYILLPGKEDEYKDCNNVKCISCGWKGIFHDLVPKPGKTGFKVGVVNFSNGEDEFSEYNGKIYPESEAKELVLRLEKSNDADKKIFYAFEVELK